MKDSHHEQDEAAGGHENRELCLADGRVVTVSVAVRRYASTPNHLYGYLQFKTLGKTVTKYIGQVTAETRSESLRYGWKLLRSRKLVESFGWSWVVNQDK